MTAILVVCTGNICRSPLASALLRRDFADRLGPDAPVVTSAGTIAQDGEPASAGSRAVAPTVGVDLDDHAATRLTSEAVAAADLILAMAREHEDAVVRLAPEAVRRTFTLTALVRILEAAPAPNGATSLEARVAEAAVRRTASPDARDRPDDDVADPGGLPIGAYRTMAEELEDLTDRLVEGLFEREPVAAARSRRAEERGA